MKTILMTAAAVLLAASAALSQVNLGVKGGLNLYKISSDNVDESDLKTGLHLGALAHIHLSDQWALQPEVVYSMQGARTESDGDDLRLNLNYINIPVLFQFMFDNGFRLQAGPQIGILASAKAKAGGNSIDIKEGMNSIEFAVPVGLGYISPAGFGVDLRYHIGLSNINEDDNNEAFNRGFQLGVFYQFQHD